MHLNKSAEDIVYALKAKLGPTAGSDALVLGSQYKRTPEGILAPIPEVVIINQSSCVVTDVNRAQLLAASIFVSEAIEAFGQKRRIKLYDCKLEKVVLQLMPDFLGTAIVVLSEYHRRRKVNHIGTPILMSNVAEEESLGNILEISLAIRTILENLSKQKKEARNLQEIALSN